MEIMEICWQGNSSVLIKARNVNFGINPKTSDGLDLLIFTEEQKNLKLGENQFLIDSPGEYEVRSVMVYPLLSLEPINGMAWQLVAEDMSIFYTNNQNFSPTEDQLDEMGTIDIAFIPIDASKEGSNKAQKLVEALNSRIIIPIATDDEISPAVCLDMAKNLGLKCEAPIKSYKIKDRKQLPEEEQLYVALEKS